MASTTKNIEQGQTTRRLLYRTLVALTEKEHRPPSQEEVCKMSGISVGSLLHHLPRLEADGLIIRRPGSRGIIIVKQVDDDEVP